MKLFVPGFMGFIGLLLLRAFDGIAPHFAFLVTVLAGAVTTWSLVPIAKSLAWSTGYVDLPGRRKFHSRATPLLGGLAVFAGILLTFSAAGHWLGFRVLPSHGPVLLGGALALLLGLVDDRVSLTPAPKLFAQIAVAVVYLAVAGEAALGTGPIAFAVSVLWIVGIMNAVNFLDNMDGLAAGVAALAGFSGAAIALAHGSDELALLFAALTGACLGFLRFNFHPASVFLGDAGSLSLGFLLAVLSLRLVEGATAAPSVLAPALVLGYPIFDTTFVTVRRFLEGRKIYIGGKDHTSHRLHQIAPGSRRTVLTVYAASTVLGGLGVVLDQVRHPAVAAWLLLAPASVLFLFGLYLSRVPVPES
jgi:UDP-GlcNAc:undecaprenyl-phosphate GlcNAc-1-phosphate transferase